MPSTLLAKSKPYLPLLLITFYVWSIFLALSFDVATYYDQWRIGQIFLFALIAVLGALTYPRTCIIKPAIYLSLIAVFILYFVFAIFTPYFAIMVEICLYAAMVAFFIYCTRWLLDSPELIKPLLLLLGMSTIFNTLWLVIFSFFSLFSAETSIITSMGFANIRYYNDMVLPALFALWAYQQYCKNSSWVLVSMLTMVNALAVLTILLDGARAVSLSIIVAFIVIFFAYPKQRSTLKAPVISVAIALLLFLVIKFLLSIDIVVKDISEYSEPLLRATSSYRLEVWWDSFLIWLSQPILGIGPGMFPFYDEAYGEINSAFFIGHPHNIAIQLLAEMGVAGIIINMFILYFSWQLWKSRALLSPLLLGMYAAFIINSLLSGMYVYANSQVICLVLLAVIYAQYLRASKKVIFIQPDGVMTKGIRVVSAVITTVSLVMLLYVAINYLLHANDEEFFKALLAVPRFWQHASYIL